MKHQSFKLVCVLLFQLLNFNPVNAESVSELKNDETLVFFNTSAWLNQQSMQWHIPIHGWVFEPEDSTIRKQLIAQSLKTFYELETNSSTRSNFNQRVNLLLADNERNKSMVIRFANRTYAIPASAANGHFSTVLKVDAKIIAAADLTHQLTFDAVLPKHDQRQFSGQVNLVSPNGLSIISDIDDTIKISEVTNRKQLLNHTFYLDFKAVPGMADLYNHLLDHEGALHFVSSRPWQLYPALVKWLEQAGFPDAEFALKTFRFKDSSLINLFTSSLKTKPPQIIKIIERYPGRQFILVGDSGEKDPEVYAKIQQQFPQQIIKILIRNVTEEKASDDRFQALYENLPPNSWQLFTNPKNIKIDHNIAL